jgi:non-lysosomal glucosylceramidase
MIFLKRTGTLALFILFHFMLSGQEYSNDSIRNNWPFLKHYDQDHIARIALPVGGIGTGTLSLGGNGALKDWEFMNRPAKGFSGAPAGNRAPFLALFVQTEDGKKYTTSLMGPLEYFEYEHMEGRGADNHGLPRFRECSFDASYPFGRVNLSDPDLPVDVEIYAFNPLIPGDADNSGIPIAVFRILVKNKTDQKMTASVCWVMENFIGEDGSNVTQDWKGDWVPQGAKGNVNEYREGESLKGIYMYSEGVDPEHEAWGTIAVTTPDNQQISCRTSSVPGDWGNDLLDFWDDFSTDGELTEKEVRVGETPQASLAVKGEVDGKAEKMFTYYLTWHFPNRYAWAEERVGNYYTTRYDDAWDVIRKVYPTLPDLEAKTVEFVTAFLQSDYPEVVKESALFNVSTLRTQTCFRTEDGRFFGWEGCMDTRGSCYGSCTHVWNYEQATPFLFGELAKTMRDVEFSHATDENGLMSFRVMLPLEKAQDAAMAAADGQMGTVMKMYRDWQLSGDDDMLKRLWPDVKKAIEFCWVPGGWDADMDGVMEGAQHNTMDVEYFGPNPQMGIWYLGALRAAEEMAKYLGDKPFEKKCQSLFANGIRPPMKKENVAPSLIVGMGSSDLTSPDYQLGKGCLVDQLVGQYMAHICNLGYLVKTENVRTTLHSILKYNHVESFHDHFNKMRSYVLGNEAGLLMASYPNERPEIPFPYFTEVMTGFEYTAAVGMLFEGQLGNGIRCIQDVRDRYDGRKRNPFNEAECGHHYARAMASWAEIIALSGFHYSGVEKTIRFKAFKGNYFWSNGYAWGTVSIQDYSDRKKLDFSVLSGTIVIRSFSLKSYGIHEFREEQILQAGDALSVEIKRD